MFKCSKQAYYNLLFYLCQLQQTIKQSVCQSLKLREIKSGFHDSLNSIYTAELLLRDKETNFSTVVLRVLEKPSSHPVTHFILDGLFRFTPLNVRLGIIYQFVVTEKNIGCVSCSTHIAGAPSKRNCCLTGTDDNPKQNEKEKQTTPPTTTTALN